LTLLLADTSAWLRRGHAGVLDDWQRRLAANEVATCAQLRLEILFTARSAPDYENLALELLGLVQLDCGAAQFERALDVQAQLARRGGLHHRSVKIADLVIAACAEASDAVIWHYDKDFDRIAEITGQPSDWVAPRGSL
jgi:hypothetical protein